MSLLASLSLGVAMAAAPAPDNYQTEIETWRATRVERLTAPTGWLSLVGLPWLKPGRNLIGNGPEVDIDLGRGPPEVGALNLDGERLYFFSHDRGVKINDLEALGMDLIADSAGEPTVVSFGTTQFYVIKRGERYGLRVKDSQSPTRTGFTGIDYFPISADWRIEARWEAHEPPRTIDISTVLGTVEPTPNPGRAVFSVDGKQYALEALTEEGTDELFFIVFDETSGKQTYGSGRFFYAPQPVDGKLVLDFNKAYNPPCAFTEFSTCPLPPPENRLRLAIEAGEKKYVVAR